MHVQECLILLSQNLKLLVGVQQFCRFIADLGFLSGFQPPKISLDDGALGPTDPHLVNRHLIYSEQGILFHESSECRVGNNPVLLYVHISTTCESCLGRR